MVFSLYECDYETVKKNSLVDNKTNLFYCSILLFYSHDSENAFEDNLKLL